MCMVLKNVISEKNKGHQNVIKNGQFVSAYKLHKSFLPWVRHSRPRISCSRLAPQTLSCGTETAK